MMGIGEQGFGIRDFDEEGAKAQRQEGTKEKGDRDWGGGIRDWRFELRDENLVSNNGPFKLAEE